MKRARNYFLFLKLFSALAKIYKENKRIIKWKLFGERIDRNQWSSEKGNSWETYKQLMSWSWEETKSNAPQYFERLNFCVRKCRGRVLEIGCGIGTMTKFISQSNKVTEIVTIDAYPKAIEELKSYNLPKVTALEMPLENIKFDDKRKFDTVLICEVIEHIYPDEERKMLNSLRPYIDSKTAFIVSTPIGWMPDPYHVRGFSKRNFKRHLKKYYGTPKEIDLYSGYSQVAFGWFNFKD